MRILLVTTTNLLPFALSKVLNSELDYCAIVVDEPDIAKQIFANTPPLRDKVYPFYELKECLENFHYDATVCLSLDFSTLPNAAKLYGLPKNKLVNLVLSNPINNFFVERALRYYKNHYAEFEIFSTGMSYIEYDILPTQFKRKLFNFGRGTQDLYYDCQIAKFVLSAGGGVY